jgi:hypothetical protein
VFVITAALIWYHSMVVLLVPQYNNNNLWSPNLKEILIVGSIWNIETAGIVMIYLANYYFITWFESLIGNFRLSRARCTILGRRTNFPILELQLLDLKINYFVIKRYYYIFVVV